MTFCFLHYFNPSCYIFVYNLGTLDNLALSTDIRQLLFLAINACNLEITSRPSLDINQGLKFNTSNPLRKWSRDTSPGWLCGPKYKFKTLTKNGILTIALFKVLRLNLRHATNLIVILLYNDVELNPGPALNGNLKIVTLNCRGLGNIDKSRLLLNKLGRLIKENPNTVIMLQETMIKNDHYIKLAWKGAYAITYGCGNSQGCLTLASDSVTFSNQKNIENRGHIIEISGLLVQDITAINIYAPSGYTNEKRTFFEEVLDLIENSVHRNVILAGDFNLTFPDSDRHNRNTCVGESNIAASVMNRLEQLDMKDLWLGYEGMTWKRGATMSRLDRIFTRLNCLQLLGIATNWTTCDSDHALVTATFSLKINKLKRPRVTNLNPMVVTDHDKLAILRQYLIEQLATMRPDADPHLKLEFAKVTIRTKALELGKCMLDEESINLNLIEEDIKVHERLLMGNITGQEQTEIILHLERQTNEKNRILDMQGKNLAWKAKTKWYNEGERSNKYFLNLLKKKTGNSEMASLSEEGVLVTEPAEIEKLVNDYYRKLYSSDTNGIRHDNNFLSELFKLQTEETGIMNAPITMAEIYAALKPLKDTAPGPDGISHMYLKKLWDIVGPLILEAWLFSVENNKLPPSHEKSYLRLIPKAGKDCQLLKNWRPITLSNCDHKLITRVYNNRLINLLSKYIINTQTAYIKKRNITDNIRILSAAI